MNYKDLKPKFSIGDNVYAVLNNMICKKTVIGIKIYSFPNEELNPFRYQLVNPNENEDIWVHEDDLYKTKQELLADFEIVEEDETMTFDELAKNNAVDIKFRKRI